MTPAILTGLAVGDALGMPFEASGEKLHLDLAAWTGDMRPGLWHKLPAGHWTDDTEMATALAESLVAHEYFNPADVAARYLAWAQGTPHGMGGTTRRALENLAAGKPHTESGVRFADGEELKVGNGTAMRCAPLAYLFDPVKERVVNGQKIAAGQAEALFTCAVEDARITHHHLEAASASLAVVFAVEGCLRRQGSLMTPERLLESARQASLRGLPVMTTHVSLAIEKTQALWSGEQPTPEVVAGAIGRAGNAMYTTATALYCAAYHLDDFGAGVRAAVRGGGDTDTRAAIVGAILGARHGLEGIPAEYLAVLHEQERLQALDAQLYALRGR